MPGLAKPRNESDDMLGIAIFTVENDIHWLIPHHFVCEHNLGNAHDGKNMYDSHEKILLPDVREKLS